MGEGREYVSRSDEMGNIHISEDVIAVIAAAAAKDVDGVGGLTGGFGGDLADLVAGKKMNRGIDIHFDEEKVSVRVSILVKHGHIVTDVARNVQDAVWSAVENTTGLQVECVNVHVSGVSFPK